MGRKKLLFLIAGAVVIVTAAFLLFFFLRQPTAEPVADNQLSGQFIDPLTGLKVDKEPSFFPVSIMLDNAYEVPYDFGLEEAPIVFEALVEGGRTRFMAIYSSQQLLDTVGPIRSLRPYFLDWAEAYGGAMMHVGGSPQALIDIESSDLVDINQMGSDDIYFYRDEKLEAPYNVFTNSSMILKASERKKIATENLTPWNYQSLAASDEHAEQQVTIEFSEANQVAWVYNKEKNNYIRFVNQERFLTPMGDQITADNLIIIHTTITDIDPIGRLTMEVLGSGDALVIRAGQVLEASWIKNDPASRLVFLDKNTQSEVALNPGKTWIEVVSDLGKVVNLFK